MACIVPRCTGSEDRIRQRLPFPFKEANRFKLWIMLAHRLDLLEADPKRVYDVTRICSKHFHSTSYIPNYPKKKLKPGTLPKLFLPGPNLPDEQYLASMRKISEQYPLPVTSRSIPDDGLFDFPQLLSMPAELLESIAIGFYSGNLTLQEDIQRSNSLLSSVTTTPCSNSNSSNSTTGLTFSMLDPLEFVKTVTVVPANPQKSFKALQTRKVLGDKQNLSNKTINSSKTGVSVSDETSTNWSPIASKGTGLVGDSAAPGTCSRSEDATPPPLPPPARPRTSHLEETRLSDTLQKQDGDCATRNENVYLHGVTTDHDLISQHQVKVFGKSISNPSVLTSILSQANLTKGGSVYVLPVNEKVETENLTNSQLEKIINQNTDGNIKNKLLKVMGLKHLTFKRYGTRGKRKRTISTQLSVKKKYRKITNGSAPKKKKQNRTGLKRTCKCNIHCRKTVVSAGVSAKIDGSLLNSDSDIFDPNNFDNMFTLSTILTNVNDKYQMEQLCQLVIECIFRLKNINIYRTMGTLTIYLTHNAVNKPGESSVSPASEPQPEQAHVEDASHINITPEEMETAVAAENLSQLVDTRYNVSSTPHFGEYSRLKHKNVELNLSAFHDHNYLSLQSKILFEKPDYLVNLINLDRYISKKRSRVLTDRMVVALNKKQISTQRFKKKLCKMEETVKKKTNFIKLLQHRIKTLKHMVIQEKGIKKFKYPKIMQNEINTNQKEETSLESSPWESFGEIDVHTDSENDFKPKKRKREKKESEEEERGEREAGGSSPRHVFRPHRRKAETSNIKYVQGVGFLSPKKRKLPTKDVTPNFDISLVLSPHEASDYIAESPQNNDLINSYKGLFDSLIEEEIIY